MLTPYHQAPNGYDFLDAKLFVSTLLFKKTFIH